MKRNSIPVAPALPPASLTVPMVRQRHPAVGRNRIYAAITNGILTGVKVGKRLAIPVDAVDEWVAAGAPTESSSPPRRKDAQKGTTSVGLPLTRKNS